MLKGEYPVRLLCQILDCSPSSYYYYCSRREDDLLLREEIEKIALEFPRYGYRRVTAELRRRGYRVNHKRVLRIMKEENLLVHVKSYLKTTLSNHHLGRYPNLIKDIQIVRPNQVWCGDITYYTFALFGFSRDESCHQTVSVGKYSQTFHGGGRWQR